MSLDFLLWFVPASEGPFIFQQLFSSHTTVHPDLNQKVHAVARDSQFRTTVGKVHFVQCRYKMVRPPTYSAARKYSSSPNTRPSLTATTYHFFRRRPCLHLTRRLVGYISTLNTLEPRPFTATPVSLSRLPDTAGSRLRRHGTPSAEHLRAQHNSAEPFGYDPDRGVIPAAPQQLRPSTPQNTF
jgi:hypothetical protein